MSSAADTTAALQALLSSLPLDANPYTALLAWLSSQLDKKLPTHFFIQLYVLAGGLGFNFLTAALSTLFIAIWGRFWVFRAENGALRPHGQTPWLLLGSLFYVFAELAIFFSIPYYRGESLPRPLIGLRTMMWWAPWTGGWIAAHSLAAGLVTHLQTTGLMKLQQALLWHRRLTIGFYTILGIFFASTAPLCGIAITKYYGIIDAYNVIEGLLKTAAAATPTPTVATFDIASLAPALPVLEGFTGGQAELVDKLSILYTLYGAWGIVLGIGFSGSALLYTRALSRTLAEARPLKLGDASNSSTTRQFAKFRKTYNTLVFTVWAFSAICSGFVAISFYVGLRTEETMNAPMSIQAVDLTMYWLYFVTGCPVGLLVLIRVIRTHQHERRYGHTSSGSRSGGHSLTGRKQPFGGRGLPAIAVEVNTVVDVQNVHTADRSAEDFEFMERDKDVELDKTKMQELYFLELGEEEGRREKQ
ncbi:hypothetical protein JCM6882_001043 [Rhodosporidiobolus microsporus]